MSGYLTIVWTITDNDINPVETHGMQKNKPNYTVDNTEAVVPKGRCPVLSSLTAFSLCDHYVNYYSKAHTIFFNSTNK